MLIHEILREVAVRSTWISNLIYNRPNKVITWKLSNGREYSVKNISRQMFDRWKAAPSKGRFFHLYVKGNYSVTRIR